MTGEPGAPIRPLDEFNRKHLENVRPPGHVNPPPRGRYHLVVIGAGPGGLVAAAAGAALGARVALVERHLMGGDCLNVGCVPSKALLRAARAWHEAAHGASEFGAPPVSGEGDFGAAMRRMRRLRSGLGRVDSVERFRSLGVDVFLGEGRFAGADTVDVAGASLRFRRAVIATGTRPTLPDLPGIREAEPLTNETLFWLTERPSRLAVVGAGPIGCEMAQAFARLGSRVTLLQRGDRVLPRDDRDAASILAAALRRDGVDLRLGARLLTLARRGEERILEYEQAGERRTLAADQILIAAGRSPNVEDLALERAGIAHAKGGVVVDDRLRTTNRRVYAVGDVCSPHRFTHAADAQARLVVANALFFGRGRAGRLLIPWCTYTSPEIARVGVTEEEASARGVPVETITVPLEDLDRAVLDGSGQGFARIHLKPGTDRILGVTLVAEHAGETIGEVALAMTAGLGLGMIGSTIHPYPTQGEILRKAADAWRRRRLTPRVRRILGLFFRVIR